MLFCHVFAQVSEHYFSLVFSFRLASTISLMYLLEKKRWMQSVRVSAMQMTLTWKKSYGTVLCFLFFPSSFSLILKIPFVYCCLYRLYSSYYYYSSSMSLLIMVEECMDFRYLFSFWTLLHPQNIFIDSFYRSL